MSGGFMRLRKENILFDIMTGAGLYLLDSVRDRFADRVDDLRERTRDTYSTASDRVRRASDVIRGEDHRFMSTTTALLLGIGVGVGVGMLLAPASGEETREQIKDKMRDRFSRESATGTYGG
jgi:gas vesicle protein